MSIPYTGGCACGALRYSVAGEPVAMVDCQCRQCQRESGTGHQSHLVFQASEVKTHGDATEWQMTGDGGTVKRRAFCPVCGSPVSMMFPAMPDIFIIRAASLDEPARYAPTMVTWTDAAQPWDHIDATLVQFRRMPVP
ncbi:GFA family protein [Rhizobium oryzicola]|uniref:GFA family protein n=1 Tax=Rhizobium oryzicola TaxID=1232668 RepID=A0ABT8SVD7_9HYPH|nr:GFA family protein [Rhizobium oryzicola]MDO1582109.1 GFA family protein [Rhizobium oryzicola]